jgi:hypothetical protein
VSYGSALRANTKHEDQDGGKGVYLVGKKG